MNDWTRSALIAMCALNGTGIANAFPPAPPQPQGEVVTVARGENRLLCFDGVSEGFGYGGTCTPNPNGTIG